MIGSLSIKTRLMAVIAFVVLGLTLATGWANWRAYQDQVQNRSNELINLTDNAMSLMNNTVEKYEAGEYTLEQAWAEAHDNLRPLRYNGGYGYFFIQATDRTFVMHPFRPDLEGLDSAKIPDPTGQKIFERLIPMAVNEGSGFLEYKWAKPGVEDPNDVDPKLAYVKLSEPLGLIVGTGMFIDDLRDIAIGKFLETLVIIAVVAGILAFLIMRIIASVTQPLKDLEASMEAIAGGDLSTEVHGVDRKDEFGPMARALSAFKDGLSERAQLENAQRIKHQQDEARRQEVNSAITSFRERSENVLRQVLATVEALRGASSDLSERLTARPLRRKTPCARQTTPLPTFRPWRRRQKNFPLLLRKSCRT